MGFKELLKDMIRRKREPLPPEPERDDMETTDKVLKSLRRQRRVQLEEGEKERLRAAITAHNRRRDARAFNTRAKPILGSGFTKAPRRRKSKKRWF